MIPYVLLYTCHLHIPTGGHSGELTVDYGLSTPLYVVATILNINLIKILRFFTVSTITLREISSYNPLRRTYNSSVKTQNKFEEVNMDLGAFPST